MTAPLQYVPFRRNFESWFFRTTCWTSPYYFGKKLNIDISYDWIFLFDYPLTSFDNLNDRDEKGNGGGVELSWKISSKSRHWLRNFHTLWSVKSQPWTRCKFLPWHWLDFTKYCDQSLELGLLDFGGLSDCTGAQKHNLHFTGYMKSVLLLQQHTMLKIVYVSHLGFLYSVVQLRTGIMTSGNNLGNRGRIPGKYSAWFVCFRSMTSSDLATRAHI